MRFITALLALTLVACSHGDPASPNPPTASAASTDALPANGAFVNRVWVSAAPGRPLGTMLVFLSNRTLIMDSCFETYRLSSWGVAGDHIRWLEDTIPIEAAISMPGSSELVLKIAGRDESQTYIAASVPYVCPDMPKQER
ncbi:MAG TPA: hypothetical protein VFR96_05945 [Povalibacter sp.]|jgi:hypothetical protein|nr:hypothetical protein [Povalibacter sp.]